jgi:hypothetical protein
VQQVAQSAELGATRWENPTPYSQVVDGGSRTQEPTAIIARTDAALHADFETIARQSGDFE